jgi:hypothetical protein
MERRAQTMSIAEIRRRFADIEFPEYQREPTVWSREQKQRLIDSILREFDIASLYFYEREDGGLECIDGRQRLNAIMSFLNDNPADSDNGFSLRIHNEVSSVDPDWLRTIDGRTFESLSADNSHETQRARGTLFGYQVAAIFLSGSLAAEEFNLQFLRLNLGTLINAGEKLHAMVGVMRDLLFEPGGVGQHPFLERVGVPTRRYAKEQVGAQVLLQVFSLSGDERFARARHFDLQKFVKLHSQIDRHDQRIREVEATLDALEQHAAALGEQLRNRAVAVSAIVAAWELELRSDASTAKSYAEFLVVFLGRLRWQVRNMKELNPDHHYDYLIEFQRHLTQAAVEKPAVKFRHETLIREFRNWASTGELTGDREYTAETNRPPPLVPHLRE